MLDDHWCMRIDLWQFPRNWCIMLDVTNCHTKTGCLGRVWDSQKHWCILKLYHLDFTRFSSGRYQTPRFWWPLPFSTPRWSGYPKPWGRWMRPKWQVSLVIDPPGKVTYPPQKDHFKMKCNHHFFLGWYVGFRGGGCSIVEVSSSSWSL